MASSIQRRRGTTSDHATFTGAVGEITIDTTKDTVVVHDGAVVGGVPLLREDGSNSSLALGSQGVPSLKFSGDLNTGIYSPGADQVAVATNGTQNLLIDASGNLIVSGANALNASVGRGNVTINGAAGSILNFTVNGADKGWIFHDNTTLTIQNTTANALLFNTNNNEKLRITSTGTLNFKGAGTAGVTQAVSFDGSAPVNSFVIDTSGRLLVGAPTARSNFFNTASSAPQRLQVEGITGNTCSLSSICSVADTSGGRLLLAHQRSGVVGGNTILNSGDETGVITFQGNDGGEFVESASISAQVDGTATINAGSFVTGRRYKIATVGTTNFTAIGASANILGVIFTATGVGADSGTATSEPYANSMPGRLVFSTTADGNASPTERMRITSGGLVGIGTTGPSSRLSIAGTTNTVDSQIILTATSVASAYLGVNADGLNLGTDTAGIVFKTGVPGGTSIGLATGEKARIRADGTFEIKGAGTAGSSPGFSVSGSAPANSAIIDTSGRLLIGTSISIAMLGVDSAIQVVGTGVDAFSSILRFSATAADCGGLLIGRSKSATKGTNTAVVQNDALGEINFAGATGTTYHGAASISAFVDGEVGTSGDTTDMPGRLVFSTTADGAAAPTERMRITSGGAVRIGSAISITPYDSLSSGTLSFEGSAGQLFSITNNLTTGSIFSVNDVSGIPSIDVNAAGTISLGAYGGNVGIGTSTPSSKLHVIGNLEVAGASTTNTTLKIESSATGSERSSVHFFNGAISRGRIGGSNDFNGLTLDSSTTEAAASIRFRIGGTSLSPKMTLDSSGRLLVGTDTSGNGALVQIKQENNLTSSTVTLNPAGGLTVQDATNTGNYGSGIWFNHGGLNSGIAGARNVTNNWGTDLRFYTHPDTTTNVNDVTERMRISSAGNVLVGTTSNDPAGTNVNGVAVRPDGYASGFTGEGGPACKFNRKANDGEVLLIIQDGTQEGSISVSANTVSYNQFLGSHWSALTDWSRPEIKIGTILETINELTDWKLAVIEVNGEQKKICYNGTAMLGTTVSIEYEGETYEGIIELETDPEFNKAIKVKVNDTAASKAVYGVFVAWNTDNSHDGGVWNDMYVGAVGNYVIRMAVGETPKIGDLVESNGTGCAVIQEDDIIRTKTVAKITSTIPQVTYDDGSFLVTCVLCCG